LRIAAEERRKNGGPKIVYPEDDYEFAEAIQPKDEEDAFEDAMD